MLITYASVYISTMSVNVTAILKEAASRSVKRNGLILMGLLFALSIVSGLLGAGLAQSVDQQFVPVEAQTTALVVLPPLVAGLLSLVIGLATLVVSIAAIRVFVSDETQRLPREYFTRRMGWAGLNFIVGGIVFGIAVALGFVALIIPGIFLLVALAFWTVFVAVEDQNFIESFRSSWGLTRGHRLKLLMLGIVVVLVSAIVGSLSGIATVGSESVGFVLVQAGSALMGVFSTAVLAAAYTEITGRHDEEDEFSVEEESTSPREGVETI